MNSFYNTLPFGVMILRGPELRVSYVNAKFIEMFDCENIEFNTSFMDIEMIKKIHEEVFNCYASKKQQHLNETELVKDRYFNIVFNYKEESLELYFYDVTNLALENQKNEEINQQRIKKEREKFLNISTELKTKCDIIEILRAREKEHLMHLKDVINNISEGLIVIDNKGKFSLCNRAAYKITELNMGELINGVTLTSKYTVFTCDEHGENLYDISKSFLKKDEVIKNSVTKLVDKSTGKIKYIEMSSNPILNKNKEILYTIVTLKDITETKLHQINAEDQAKFVEDVVNTIDVPIAVIDYPELKYKLVNKNHEKLVRYLKDHSIKNDSLVGKSLGETSCDYIDENLVEIIRVVGEKGKEYLCSPYLITDEMGKERFFKIKIKPHEDSEGNVVRIHMHGLDITEEVKHAMELEKVTRLKDEFFTVISHELRTPLTIIYSSLQLAYDIYESELTPNINKTLWRIDQNCSRLLKLINNILDLSKAEAGFLVLNTAQFNIVYTTEFIVNSVNLYAKSKGIELIFDTNEEDTEVNLDKDKYEKILLNLLSNAIKFTPDGKQIMVSLYIDEEHVTLSVKDEGIGIPENKIDYIFDRFAQVNTSLSRRAEGTGIGLSLVKRFVELMNGKIQVISKEGMGTEFQVTFNKICTNNNSLTNYAMFDTSMKDKINIEFSDIN